MVVMIRYWFFAAFVLTVSAKRAGSVANAARTKQPVLQIGRGLLLAAEVCVMVLAFTLLGLIESLAIFACYPLIVAALSGPVLGEQVGPRRWAAIAVGFVGVLIMLQPGLKVFSPAAFVALTSASMFALYSLLTRYAARQDKAATSFFWTGVAGAVGRHYLLIRVYELAEASAVQPFAYLQLAFASVIGVLVFDETIALNVAIGVALVIGAGLFTLWRTKVSDAEPR